MLMKWFAGSLRRQLVALYCLPVLVGLILMNVIHTTGQVREMKQVATAQAVELMHTTAAALSEDARYRDYFALWKTLSGVQERIRIRSEKSASGFFHVDALALLSEDAELIYAHTDPSAYPTLSAHPELASELLYEGTHERVLETLTRWDVGNDPGLKVLAPVWFQGDLVGVLRADLDVGPLLARVHQARAQAVQETALLLAVGLFIIILFSGYLTRIIGRMVHESRRIGSGDVDLDKAGRMHNELGLLASALASADQRIFTTRRERDEYAETLQAVMDNSPFGIWLTDGEGRIRFANQTMADSLGEEDPARLEGQAIGDLIDRQVQEEFSGTTGRGMDSNKLQTLFTSWMVPDQGVCDFKISRILIHDRSGQVTGFVGIAEDVTESSKLQREIQHQATHDGLTGLMNRNAFETKLEQVCRAIGPRDTPHALCYLDLDRFKRVNDTCGHHAGDALLRQLTSLYRSHLRKTEPSVAGKKNLDPALARLGGDEFALLLYNCSLEDAQAVAQRLIDITRDFRFNYEGKQFSIGCSIGVVAVTDTNSGGVRALKQADDACYTAKEQGRSRVHVATAEGAEVVAHQGASQWAARIQDAINSDRLGLFIQVMTSLNGRQKGDRFEVLMRYREDDGKVALPGAFLPTAERYFLMPMLDRWVIERSFEQAERIYGAGTDRELDCITINLSGQTLSEKWLFDCMVEQFANSSIRPEQICFDISESVAISSLDRVSRVIGQLKGLGCQFALDNFGSALSSCAYLNDLDLDYLKIDGTQVKRLGWSPVDREVVAAIHRVARVMGLKTVAGWVETEDALTALKEIGVDYAQGYHVARPVPFTALAVPGQAHGDS